MTAGTILPIVLAFGVGIAVGAWLFGLRARRIAGRLAAAEATSRVESDRRQQLEAEFEGSQRTVRELDRQLAVAEERGKIFEDARRELESRFEALAHQALRGNAEQFLTLAGERLATSRAQATADLDERKQAIEALLQPLAESLNRLDLRTNELERSRVDAYSRLDEQVRHLVQTTQALQNRTTSLTTALKGSRVSGVWGEIALRNIAELAGMTKHCDFDEQVTLADGRRPDMIVRLPGDRQIAVDAKAPLAAYLDAVEATNPQRRSAALDRHVKALRGHIRTLADRSYAESLGRNVDLVVLFLPGDPILAAAFEREPELQTEALRHKVLIATPTTLVALLRTVAIYWQQSAVVENAEAIAAAARDLYERAAKFGGDLQKLGRGLKSALDAYNTAVGSFERRLMPMGRKLEEMKVTEQSRRRLDAPEPIDEAPRQVALETAAESTD
ncbi:MAG: DNA recombination protein RmuC [Acidobacteriota bacterium]|nr:DNA recombination protein RmuC [Acidobacteriota bacterium]